MKTNEKLAKFGRDWYGRYNHVGSGSLRTGEIHIYGWDRDGNEVSGH